MAVIGWLLLALTAGSAVFCALVVIAAWQYRRARPPALAHPVPISILKPHAGLDEGLEENLRSFFEQDYPAEFEILFATRTADDPCLPVIEKVRREYPGVPTAVIVTGEPPYVNAKAYSLELMLAAAHHDVIVMADSDTRVPPQLLRVLAAEFQDPAVGVATSPYRAMGGRDPWSDLEAIGMNTELLAGVLVARMLEGMKFALGVVLTARRQTIEAIGGFARTKDYLTDDFIIGAAAVEAGWGSILSCCVIEHRLGTQTFRSNFQHRLRWVRGARRMRPAGYFGELFTHPLPLALMLVAAAPQFWPVMAATIALRLAAAWATAAWILHSRSTLLRFWMFFLQDLSGFAFWIAGFFGCTVVWRGRRYTLSNDGRFERAEPPRATGATDEAAGE